MNWKDYEKEILTYFQDTYPETNITYDQKIAGKFSKVLRQIDILIEGDIAGYTSRIVIDCKCFSKKIDVKEVERFCSMLDDIEAHQGVLITQKGYSKAAINKAHYGNHKLELDIINFDELKSFQSIEAWPYVGHFCVIIFAPFGWVLDLVGRFNSFATIHQRGITLKEAQKQNEWMYMDFWKKDSKIPDIDSLINFQNKKVIGFNNSSKIHYNNSIKRSDQYITKIRIADIPNYPSLEVTGFIEFDDYIFFIVLFTTRELLNKNLRKLQHLLKVSIPTHIHFDNKQVIEQCLSTISDSSNKNEKAEKYFLIGKWYKEMDDFEKSFDYVEKAIECLPNNSNYLKKIIEESLWLNLPNKSKKYTIQLFEIEPRNPAISQMLIEIFLKCDKIDLLIEYFLDRVHFHTDNEILGNLAFHLGNLYHSIESKKQALEQIRLAKVYFAKVFLKSHHVFKTILECEKNWA